MAGSLFGGVLAVAGQRVWRAAGDRIDRAFFRGAFDARRLLEQLATESRVAMDRRALAGSIERTVQEAVRPISIHVFLREEPGQLVSQPLRRGRRP